MGRIFSKIIYTNIYDTINDTCLIHLLSALLGTPCLSPLIKWKLVPVTYSEVETPGSFLNWRKYEPRYLYILWVRCSLVFGKTNRVTYCEWLRTELHYQSPAWLCTNSVGHSGHFAAYEYFRQDESLTASWWINTGKQDFFLFYSSLSKYYCH